VDAPCAHTVGRKSHSQWVQRRKKALTCPVCNSRLRSSHVAPNTALREAIDDWCTTNGYQSSDDNEPMSLVSPSGNSTEVFFDDDDYQFHQDQIPNFTIYLQAPPGSLGLIIEHSPLGAVIDEVLDYSPLRNQVVHGDVITHINDVELATTASTSESLIDSVALTRRELQATLTQTRQIAISRMLQP